jgi:hypothetical protein
MRRRETLTESIKATVTRESRICYEVGNKFAVKNLTGSRRGIRRRILGIRRKFEYVLIIPTINRRFGYTSHPGDNHLAAGERPPLALCANQLVSSHFRSLQPLTSAGLLMFHPTAPKLRSCKKVGEIGQRRVPGPRPVRIKGEPACAISIGNKLRAGQVG